MNSSVGCRLTYWGQTVTSAEAWLLYVHRNRKESPGRPPRLWHSSWVLRTTTGRSMDLQNDLQVHGTMELERKEPPVSLVSRPRLHLAVHYWVIRLPARGAVRCVSSDSSRNLQAVDNGLELFLLPNRPFSAGTATTVWVTQGASCPVTEFDKYARWSVCVCVGGGGGGRGEGSR